MLCVEDYLDALAWAESIGLEGLFKRSQANLKVVEDWVAGRNWIAFLAEDKAVRSNTSVCLKIISEKFRAMSEKERGDFIKAVASRLSKEGAAHDVSAYRDAPPGFRFWCGPTIEPGDVKQALEALEKVYLQTIR
jgi:phosphoserine aminotransferase